MKKGKEVKFHGLPRRKKERERERERKKHHGHLAALSCLLPFRPLLLIIPPNGIHNNWRMEY